ncbi:hypothetical protein [Oceanobacillus sojae]|uniref:Uncharacterized protein n=1 Tax=Oceanobacillus sojae TaxID=582851 RepID=A0A511ZLN2_9BACI|nr:hypothetical protein [Oceanobacillus sojae]GEN88358.1 hypothetical protein OSO01_30970 [Oceanobacillus sojae]
MKKKIKRLFLKDKGSVSIYAIIIILPIFVLNALLIDTLRILSAERQIDSAMETALRSTMSHFSSDLADVGLFAYGGEDAGTDFTTYMNNQFYSSSELSGTQNLSRPMITSATASFDTSRNLVDYSVFRHQVVESMKYQAPVQMGTDLFDLLTNNDISVEDVEKAEELVENYEEILDLMKKRNAEIDKAIEQLTPYNKLIKEDIGAEVIGKKVTSDEETIPEGIETFQQLVFYLDRYQELKEKKENEEELTSDEEKEITSYEDGVKEKPYKSVIDMEIYHTDIPKHLVGSNRDVNNPASGSAKDYNDQINELMGGSESLEELEEFTLNDEFFTDILDNEDQIYENIRFDKSLEGSPEQGNLGNFSVGQLFLAFYVAIEDGDKALADAIVQSIENKLGNLKKGQVKKIEDQMQKYDKVKKALENVDIQAEEEKADESFGSLWAELNKYNDIKNQISGDNQLYAELDSIIAEYDGVTGQGGDDGESSRLQFIKDAFERFKEFVEFMQGFPTSVRNELYINEYIMANYGSKAPYELASAESYAFSTKKAQYITYGYNVAGMNYFMFMKDIALILFVGNLIGQGLQGGFAGPLGFFKALSGALITTLQDVNTLTTGKYTLQWNPFKTFGGKGVPINMPMFLRIIMAMKSTNETYNNEKARRLQAVITKETGVHLNNSPSYIEGNVQGRVKLWFIPQLAEVLPGNVEGSYYIFDRRKVYSY